MNKTVGAGEFKAKCLSLLDEVADGGPPIIVTKRGKPVVRIVRVEPKKKRKSLKGSIVYQGDITSPTDVTWDALGAARGK